jgi:hypothetical protein
MLLATVSLVLSASTQLMLKCQSIYECNDEHQHALTTNVVKNISVL